MACLQTHGNDQLWSVSRLEQISERVFNFLGYTAGLHKLQELRFNVVSSSDFSQNSLSLVQVAALD